MISKLSDTITPKELFLSRRAFLRAAGYAGAGALLAACAPGTATPSAGTPTVTGDVLTEQEQALNFNNYYEFTFSKNDVAELAKEFTTSPWQVEVSGLVNNPRSFTLEEILSSFPSEERIYRIRCVEGWSMVLPWQGFPLHRLLALVEPTPEAQFVSFETVYRPEEMSGQKTAYFNWPYLEGLRLDEAMHDLTILATGLYDEPLTPQNGAPIRLVVPWKYGFKSIKSITQIRLVKDMPPTFWNLSAPNEYGFYANVNPGVDHPRWSQATENRIGEVGRRPTLLFNGYDEVASLYAGMDLVANF